MEVLNKLLSGLPEQKKVEKYKEFVRVNSKMGTLMKQLFWDLKHYTREVLADIYGCFDPAIQQSYYGKLIKNFLNGMFSDIRSYRNI